MRIVARIVRHLTLGQPVKRRQCQKQVPVIDKLCHLAEEKRHQQRGDMRAVNVGIGHDDDPFVAQRLIAIMRARAAAECQHDIAELLVCPHLVGRRARDVEDLAAQRQNRLRLAVARLLCRAAGAVALDEKDLGAGGAVAGAIGKLSRQAQFAGRALARHLALLAPPLPLLGAFADAVEQGPAGRRIGAEPMIEMVAHRQFDEPRRLGRGEPLFGLALELRIAQKQRQQHRRAGDHIVAGGRRDAAVADQFAIRLDAAGQRGAQPGFVGAAFRRRDRVAIGMAEPVLFVLGPHDGPFDAAAARAIIGKIDLAEKRLWGQQLTIRQAGGEKIAETVRKMQPRLEGDALGPRHRRVAAPADLDPAEQIRLRARHAVQQGRAERRVAKDLGVGMKA